MPRHYTNQTLTALANLGRRVAASTLRYSRALDFHLRWWAGDLWTLAHRAVAGFFRDHCPQLAASMSYYVFFALFPLLILVVSVAGVLLTDDLLRERVVDRLYDLLPAGAGREDLEALIDPIATGRSAVGVVSVLGLFWASSGMMAALRFSMETIWHRESRRPFLRGKLVDFGLVLSVGALVALSIASTAVLQVGREVSEAFSDTLGPFGAEASGIFSVFSWLLPFMLTFVTFTLIYKVVPSVPTRFRDVWVGAVVAAALFEALKLLFAVYLRNFSNYDAVYGSLGAAIALLFFVFLGACTLLFGAEIASEWPRVMRGHYDHAPSSGASDPWRTRLGELVARQIRHESPADNHNPTPERREARMSRDDRLARRSAERSERLGEP